MQLGRPIALIIISVLAITAAQAQGADAEQRRQEIDLNASRSLEKLFAQRGNARALYDQAVGYAVFSATKAGFVVSGGRGTGVVVNKQSGARTYMRMITGGVGLGIGAQTYDLILFFQTDGRLAEFLNGSWDANTSAQAAAGNEGVGVASTFVDGVAVYQITDKGLMAWADVSGTRFRVLRDLN
jgi:lipid-binding SYLF domain-containing protein